MTTNLRSPHRAACQWPGKQRYATEQAGRRAVSLGLDFRPYLCACGWWHLTTKPQRGAAARRTNSRTRPSDSKGTP